MKRLWLLLIFSVPAFAFAQDSISLKWVNDRIEFPKHIRINNRKSYKLKLTGINTAHHQLILQAKSFELYTPLPDILKSIIGATGSILLDGENKGKEIGKDDNKNSSLKLNAMQRLKYIKLKADSLHHLSKNQPQQILALSRLDSLLALYDCDGNVNLLVQKVKDDISNISTRSDMVKGLISNLTSFNDEVAQQYSVILQNGEDIQNNNYLRYLQYIINSCEAKSEVKTKSFKSEKDLTELHLILIDTYSNDTLYNETKTVYSYPTFGLSFSTGFFYTEGLGDTPYYLENRSDGNVAVKEDARTLSDISIGALGHLYYKCSPFLRFGPSFGLSVSPFDGKSRYLLGLSVLFGQERMVGITVGQAWTKVNHLSAAVKQDGNGYYLPAGATAIPQYQSLRSAMFIGLTYNLMATRK